MKETIAVAGATGNLGKRIVNALVAHGASAVAPVRVGSSEDKIEDLKRMGAKVKLLDMSDVEQLASAIDGASCVVSALQGLRDVIVDTQSSLLRAAVKAEAPRFIPSDYCVDFRPQPEGENRNFDLRREFQVILNKAPVKGTSIFNGAFADILTYNIPLYDAKKTVIGYWDDPDWRVDFTTMDDTAAFTAAAALDSQAPDALHIASFQVSANDLHKYTVDVLHTPFTLVRIGSVAELAEQNRRERAADPEGEHELYSAWQQSQYMQSMFTVHHPSLDNTRYEHLTWTPLSDILKPQAQ